MNPSKEQNEKSISIQELFLLLKKYWVLVLVAGILGGVLANGASRLFVAPVYEASAKMIVNSRQEQNGTVTNDQLTSALKLADTYAIIIRSRPVLEPVLENLDLSLSVESLASMVSVTSVNETQVIQIAVRSKDAELALKLTEQIVKICPDIIINAVEAGSVKTIEPAYLKESPVAPNINMTTLVVAFLCMAAVVIVVLLRFLFDNTYKSESDLRNDLAVPVLGVIPDYQRCLKKNEGKEGKYHGKE